MILSHIAQAYVTIFPRHALGSTLIIQQRRRLVNRHCLFRAYMGTMRLQRRRHAPISGRLRATAARVVRLGYDPGLATRKLILSTLAASS